jgi:HK97 family phage major capsid protein
MNTSTLPPVNERQLSTFRESLGKWATDVMGRRKPSGLAVDYSKAYASSIGEVLDDRSLYVSLENLRGLSAGTQNQGGELIGTEISELVYALRPFSALIAAGVQTDQREGNLAVRREVTGVTAGWYAESDQVSEGTEFYGQATGIPHRLSLFLKYTRQLEHQSNVGEAVRTTSLRAIAQGLDRGGLQGTGIVGEPTGIFSTSGVQTVTFSAAATWANVVSFISKVAQNNALEANIRWIAAPQVREKWATVQRASGTSSFLWNDDDTVAGKRAFVTTNCPSTSICCGDFTLASFVFWGPAMFTIDPFTQKRSEQIEITVTQMCDFITPFPGAYCINSGSATQ